MHPELHIPISNKIEIVAKREGGLVEAYVPIDSINHLAVAVNEDHVQDIVSSMMTEREKEPEANGQLSPILLGHNSEWGEFEIIDGFHRDAALRRIGEERVFATIRPNTSIEELIDLRITTAQTHETVEFARIINWAKDAWNLTPWTSEMNIIDAFSIAKSKGKNRKASYLEPETAQAIESWIKTKCGIWRINPGKIVTYLTTSELADPSLTQDARGRTSGSKLESLTPRHLTELIKVVPRRFDLQRVIAEYAIEAGLTVERIRYAAIYAARANTVEEARQVLESGAWKEMEPVYTPYEPPKNSETNPDYEKMFELFFENEMEIARLSIALAVTTGRYQIDNRSSTPPIELDPETEGIIDEPDTKDELNNENQDTITQTHDWSADEEAYIAKLMMNNIDNLTSFFHKRYPKVDIDTINGIASETALEIIIAIRKGKIAKTFQQDDAFFRLYRKQLGFRMIDHLRKEQGGRISNSHKVNLVELPEDDGGELQLGLEAIEYSAIEDADETRSRLEIVKQVLPKLGTEARRTLVLRLFFNLSNQDIAGVMGKDKGTIDSTIMQAKNRVKSLLKIS